MSRRTRWDEIKATETLEGAARRAYEDEALPIGYGQTISQPFMVATICALLLVGACLTHRLCRPSSSST